MKKKNTNSFVAHLENRTDLLEERDREHEKQMLLQEETLERMENYQKGMLGIYVVVGFLLLGIAFFWWNISRDKFYAVLDEPFDNSAVERLLYEIDASKAQQPDIGTINNIDWGALIDEIEKQDGNDLTDEEESILLNLVKQLDDGKKVEEIIENLEEETIPVE